MPRMPTGILFNQDCMAFVYECIYPCRRKGYSVFPFFYLFWNPDNHSGSLVAIMLSCFIHNLFFFYPFF
jgi:hypothetical protein